MSSFPEYSGWSYEQASREGTRLVQKAVHDNSWFTIVDRLAELRRIMDAQFMKAW